MALDAAGGWHALFYSLRRARRAGGVLKVLRRLRSRNACKTCAVGMGGQRGGMANEKGRFPEVCKKSIQAQTADMQAPIAESVLSEFPFARMGRLSPREMEDLGRLGFPLVAGPEDAGFRRTTWDEALDLAARGLLASKPDEAVFYASGRASNEAAFLLQTFARAYGTNNVNNCSFYCHQASGVALGRSVGTGTATVTLDDLEHADLALVIGANPASNHPRLIPELIRLRKRGGKVVVINPVKELGLLRFRIPSDPMSLLFGSTVSDLYIQPHIGGDIALLTGILKSLIARGAVDRDYLARETEGWEAVEAGARAASWEAIERDSGVARARIDEVAALYAASRGTIFLWAMGLTHHLHGVNNVQAVVNLALARGMVGAPGRGLLPIRGHSNVQGVGSVGFTPALKKDLEGALERVYGIQAPASAGLTTFETMRAAHEGKLRVLFHLGGNLYGSNPDSRHAREALSRVGTTIFLSTKLNTGHVHGRGSTTIVLPVKARDEESQATTQESMFNFVRLSEGGGRPATPEMRSEVEVITELAARVLPSGPIDWRRLTRHEAIRAEIAKVVPGYEAIGSIDATRQEFTVGGRTRHEPGFPTPSRRARMIATPLPDNAVPAGHFRLMTIRSEGQFNTVVYEDEDLYRDGAGRDALLMHPSDASARGLAAGERVRVASASGAMDLVVRLFDIAPGNVAAYYPEANVVIPRAIDPLSGTPAFKSVAVSVEKIVRGAARSPAGAALTGSGTPA